MCGAEDPHPPRWDKPVLSPSRSCRCAERRGARCFRPLVQVEFTDLEITFTLVLFTIKVISRGEKLPLTGRNLEQHQANEEEARCFNTEDPKVPSRG